MGPQSWNRQRIFMFIREIETIGWKIGGSGNINLISSICCNCGGWHVQNIQSRCFSSKAISQEELIWQLEGC